MSHDLLQERAALYAAGAMPAPERDAFEVLLEYQVELRAQVARLQEAMALVAFTGTVREVAPPAGLKGRILSAVPESVSAPAPEALVVAGPGGLVEWVNPAFTEMCGYSLDELRGRKPGHLLQGPGTDPAAVARIRAALRSATPCRETLVNYHKDGSAYRVDLRITPVLDDAGQPLYFVARERKLRPEEVAA